MPQLCSIVCGVGLNVVGLSEVTGIVLTLNGCTEVLCQLQANSIW